ncbi:MAG TPA: hypothetical protein VND93_13000 [Myxococcales bacterium]|nr:hypothetical protein [Myxococcales bacterium]
MTRTRLIAVLTTVGAGALLWSARPAQAFVPSCTTELSANYPPVLRADLSACKAQEAPKPSPAIDLKQFTEQLDGTWVLQSRTVQGITQPSNSRYHIEIDQLKNGGAVGSAVLLDCADADCTQSRVAGMWSLDLGATKDRIAVTTSGKVVMPAGKEVKVAMDSTTLSKFFQQEGVFVALDKDVGPQLGDKRGWDRVVLTERTLTYISCADGRVDRFVKVSGSALVDGTPVRELQKTLVVGRMIKTERRPQ